MRAAMLPVALGRPGRPARPLPPGEVHAWLVTLAGTQAMTSRSTVLSGVERSRARRFARGADGMRFAAARSALRLILAGYLDEDPARLALRTGANGRPELARAAGGSSLDFSLSHSGDLALVAVSARAVGADVEAMVPRAGLADIALARFPSAEAARIAAGCCGPPPDSFYRHWTAKEAYLKLTGIGLAGLRTIGFDCRGDPVITCDGQAAAGVLIAPLDVSPRHAAAVAASLPVTSFRLLEG
jgi:4'-phosphopantetheinyl transferase